MNWRRGRQAAVAVIALIVLISASAVPAHAMQLQAATPSPIDPAAIVLSPGDIGEAGYYHDGAFVESLEDVAVNLATYRGGEPGDIQDALRAAGWTRKYVTISRQPTAPNASTYRQAVMCYITEFRDAAGASQGFDITEDEQGVATAHDLPTSAAIGDRSEMTMDQGTSGVSGQHYVSFDLTFQLDRYTAGVTLYLYDTANESAATPVATPIASSTTEVERLANTLAQRLSSSADQLGFTNLIQRLDADDAEYITYDDAYYRLDGQDIPLLNERSSAATARTASYGNATDVYQLWQGIDAATSDGLLFAAALFQFPSVADASAWLQNAPDELATNRAYPRLATDATPVSIGDESMALTYTPRGTDPKLKATIIIARVDSVVLRIQLAPVGNHQRTTRPLVEHLATAQAACLRNEACPSIPLPAD